MAATAFKKIFMRKSFLCFAAMVLMGNGIANAQMVTVLPKAEIEGINANYPSNRAPLLPQQFIKLPVTAFKPSGW